MMLLLWHLALDWLSFCKVVWKGVRVSLVCSVCLSQISDPLKSYPYIYIYIYDHCYLPQFCILYLQLFSFKKFSFFPMFFPHGVWRSKKSALIELAFPFNFSIFCEQLNLSTVAMLANPSSPCYQSPELQHILIFSSTPQYTYALLHEARISLKCCTTTTWSLNTPLHGIIILFSPSGNSIAVTC